MWKVLHLALEPSTMGNVRVYESNTEGGGGKVEEKNLKCFI